MLFMAVQSDCVLVLKLYLTRQRVCALGFAAVGLICFYLSKVCISAFY